MMKKVFALLLAASLALPGLAQETFNRGFEGKNKIFIPKGSLGGGLSASWRNFSLGEDEGYTLISKLVGDLKGGYRTVSVAPSFEFFLADNLSVVARLDYSRLDVDLDSASLNLSEGLGLGLPLARRHIINLGGTLTLEGLARDLARISFSVERKLS